MTTTIGTNVAGTVGTLSVGGAEKMKFGADTSGQPFGFRNLLVNSTFQVNNGNAGTPYASAAVLAAGTYGHEMWKAGASGGDYSFTQNPAITTITIAAGKSLVQVIEDKFVEGGSYVLSWTGTAQARVTINSATPSGSFASSPILVTGQTVGTTMCVEFNTGTLSKAQLEVGSIATKFEFSQFELQRTQRYAEMGLTVIIDAYPSGSSGAVSTGQICFKATKRTATPTMAQLPASSSSNVGANTFTVTTAESSGVSMTIAGAAGLYSLNLYWLATARL